jgi:hypothetical protein
MSDTHPLQPALDAAVVDLSSLEQLDVATLDALYEFGAERLVELYGAGDADAVAAVTAVCRRVWTLLAERRPWTVFTTCTGSSTWWVAGGEDAATAAFASWLGRDPYSRCGQCGDTNWHVVDVAIDATPSDDDAVLDPDARD